MFKLEEAPDCYLFVQPGTSFWRISSDLRAEKSFLRSRSASQDCPAHPKNSFSTRSSVKGWSFNNAVENAKVDWEMAEISIRCTTHHFQSAGPPPPPPPPPPGGTFPAPPGASSKPTPPRAAKPGGGLSLADQLKGAPSLKQAPPQGISEPYGY